MKQEQIDQLQAVLNSGLTTERKFLGVESRGLKSEEEIHFDADAFVALARAAPALLEAAREVAKLQELRKKWGGDDYGHLSLAEAFDAYCNAKSEENLRLRELLKESESILEYMWHAGYSAQTGKPTSDEQKYLIKADSWKLNRDKALGKETA